MADGTLTPADLKARFPAFAAAPDAAVAGALAEAAIQFDHTWAPGERDLARMLYAAHVLTLDGFGPEGEWARAGDPRVLRSGTLQVERRETGTDLPGTLGRTSYGRRFHEALLRNSPGIVVV
ncbi:DUF4054 domain-containing protein [Methylobacterium nodulans]|uniref:DUF4054 domain-containing protein n=1 Tax=Methylobacterium nodulans (strain LMG 21967 / CNCM I-2342 / ORS 2060) TaxID=460265 RepID=B8IDG7_METNO|nr:DUF4054 domain-containing protein [Methylobacterium nodulans]ACL61333.1 conserved hypothetical protein [Methylobacterium nodulans ORS 2060]